MVLLQQMFPHTNGSQLDFNTKHAVFKWDHTFSLHGKYIVLNCGMHGFQILKPIFHI